VFDDILTDIANTYPTLVGDFIKDKARLRSFLKCRGIHAICVDMVAAAKHLEQCLAAGEYKLSGLPLTKRYSNRVVIPRFLRGLYLLIFEECGTLKGDCDAEAINFLRQVLYLGRKADLQCSDDAVQKEVKDFIAVDSALPEPSGFWNLEQPDARDVEREFVDFRRDPRYTKRIEAEKDPTKREALFAFLSNLDKVSRFLTSSLGVYNPSDWRFRHGPGAVSERRGRFYNKFCWTNWSRRLENVFPFADCGFHNYASWARSACESKVGSTDPASRLISVWKTFTKPRLIAAEPSEHQWCQQNIWHYFCDRSRKTWIGDCVRFRDQSRNQELCLRGSRDGSLATVDLSAASDRVTCDLVGTFFSGNAPLVLALQASRTRFLEQDICKDADGRLALRKFSTMGSACTFPVQSLIFFGICLAAIATKRRITVGPTKLRLLARDVAVFGDDLIVPTDSRELLFWALELLHFKVNTSKSFWTGLFRESCGVDAYRGVNVTPAYWRSVYSNSPASLASVVEQHNNFQKKFFVHTARGIASTIPKGLVPTVSMGAGCGGLTSFARPGLSQHTLRWNKDLQRYEYKVGQIISSQLRTPITDDSAILQYFTEGPSPYHTWKGGVPQSPKLKFKLRWVPASDLVNHESA
jgi:hypothetical protein